MNTANLKAFEPKAFHSVEVTGDGVANEGLSEHWLELLKWVTRY